ncbi:hypothetical protein E3N88_44471 [Mikania micrantha]|uniref:Uncharacterized protein n=1 Tax=Mikania micrantha TaxID=192012 RepID=A0A5N6LBX6_9ASTR|nr:hypothetical protein E3N88_44471 [Mikania micrantha]
MLLWVATVVRSSGMYTVKVHEWHLVCYWWLALACATQLPPDIPFHLSVKAYIANTDCGFPVVAYLSRGTFVGWWCWVMSKRKVTWLIRCSSHMLVSKIKPCMCKYEQIQTVKLRMAH